MDVSIIVPCCARTQASLTLLDETLDTVGEQTLPHYELVVVDDGSPLDVAACVARHPRARTVRQHNAGPAIARNTGIVASRGDYLVFLDADDHLLPRALEAGRSALDEHPECGFAVGPREEMTFEGEPVPWQVPPPPPQSRIYESLLGFEWYIIPPSSAMFRRSTVESIGGFQNPWGADDLDFYLRAAWRFAACCYQDPPVTRYRRYSSSSSRDGERMLHSIRAVYERQRAVVHGEPGLEAAYERGLRQLTQIFLDCLVENIADRRRAGEGDRVRRAVELLARESPERWRQIAEAGSDVSR